MELDTNSSFNQSASATGQDIASSRSTLSIAPVMTIDWKMYESYLQESDWSDDQKREFVETIWQIVVMFVDLGFGIESGQLAQREALKGKPAAADEKVGARRRQVRQASTDAKRGAE